MVLYNQLELNSNCTIHISLVRIAQKLNKKKLRSKRNDYSTHFTKGKNNLKATWELTGTLIQHKLKSKQFQNQLRRNKVYTEKKTL